MSSSSSTTTKEREGFLKTDINKFLQAGATLAGPGSGQLKTPGKVRKTTMKIHKKSKGFLNLGVEQSREFFDPGFSDISEDQLTRLVTAFTEREKEVEVSRRSPEAFGRRQSMLVRP